MGAMIFISWSLAILVICIKVLVNGHKKRVNRGNIIKTTILVNSQDIQTKKGSIVKGAVGGAVFGLPGAIIGSSNTIQSTNTTTFLVEYEDGSKEVMAVPTNSYKFNKLCKYLDM